MKITKVNRKYLAPYEKAFSEKLEKDPAFKLIWEANATKREIVKMLIGARIKHKITQEELAKRIGTKQANIARLEGGRVGVSIDTLSKIAKVFGTQLKISFEPKTNSGVQLTS